MQEDRRLLRAATVLIRGSETQAWSLSESEAEERRMAFNRSAKQHQSVRSASHRPKSKEPSPSPYVISSFTGSIWELEVLIIYILVLICGRNELETYYSTFAIAIEHRNEYVSVPVSHVKFQLPRALPLTVLVDLSPFRMSATIHGYTLEGSFRYDPGQKHRLSHVRIVAYHNDEHATHSTKYNGSWIVLPPFRDPLFQTRLWCALTRLVSRATGLHPFHRLATCSTPDDVQLRL